MSHSQRYALWMYEDVKTIKEDKLYLVRNKQTEELAVKRYIRKELIPVYQALKEKRSLYLPIIYEIQIENLRGIVITEFIQGITLQKILDENEIKKITYVYKSNVLLKNNKKSENSNIIVPENKEKINDYITLRQRKTKKDIKMDDDGIIISEKLAKLLKLKKNSYVKLTLPNNKKVNVKVSDITENYIEHYVYISPKLYKKLSGENANYSTIIAITKNLSNKKEKALESNISDINNVTSTLLSSDTKNNYKDMMNTLNYVILILIVCAATLAFVVLYNLASVNISERRRELATIKVLGFYDEEVTKYIYKEMFILTIIGSLIGLILGSFLTLYVIKICETNLFMFTFNINFISYLLSFIITLLFLFIVNLFMHFELKKLDMVEALKSYE